MVSSIRNFHRVMILSFILLAGCSLTRVESQASRIPPPTMTQNLQASLVPTIDRQVEVIPEIATDILQTTGCVALDAPPRTRHTVVADINYLAHIVNVEQTIRYINTTGDDLNQIILTVEPNRWNQVFSFTGPVRALGAVMNHTLDGKRLIIDLPESISANCEITINLAYQLSMPLIGVGVFASKGFFGYSERQLNLGHWLVTMPSRQNDDWVVHDPFIIGEQEVLESADWDVTLIMVDAPENLTIVAPGAVTQLSSIMWRYIHNDSRDFTISLSDAYNIRSQVTEAGVIVELYTFEDAIVNLNDQEIDTSVPALEWATTSLEMYSDLFGAYPYERMIIVAGDFPDGMEFSGLVFVSNDWFVRYPGAPGSYLMLITVHEVAHQWWYGRVGNDSAQDPWLDEALATYSEYIYIEEFYPTLRDWWWRFRVDSFAPDGFVDSTIYQFNDVRTYINAVYLRGVRMMDDLRNDIGTEAFFDLLFVYAEAGDGEIASPELFWSLLTPEQLEQTQSTREIYFYNPSVEVGQ